ncbi:hypothetical protein RchiOBHm_Chr5g0073851 [Rosa chinensis]|uniref:Uncharacterized protein n=1 Tax=Rosa chinensis TaxID=74649 RepID=A0A2P6QL26_ROSCH|nr:hypothetical protein RchiOBHm_Chr5g0073851 [Rosa chinensis]
MTNDWKYSIQFILGWWRGHNSQKAPETHLRKKKERRDESPLLFFICLLCCFLQVRPLLCQICVIARGEIRDIDLQSLSLSLSLIRMEDNDTPACLIQNPS